MIWFSGTPLLTLFAFKYYYLPHANYTMMVYED